jgi:hypothetical protein
VRRRRRGGLPIARTKAFSKEFRILSQDGNSVKVQGRDLIYKIPETMTELELLSRVITVIPSNPCYWTGTRVSALAQGYQNYRPLRFNVHYVPQCAATQQGNVLAGTLWNQAPTNENLQQTLRTSNGGMLTQAFKPASSKVRLKTNLQFNLYRSAGQFDQESNPFIFLAIALGCTNTQNKNIVPGYFYVTWTFIFKNPIGHTISYLNSGLIRYKNVNKNYENMTVVNLSSTDINRIGAIFQYEKTDQDNHKYYYNGSVVATNDDHYCWAYGNTSVEAAQKLALDQANIKEIKYYGITSGQPTDLQITMHVQQSGSLIVNFYYQNVSFLDEGYYFIPTNSQLIYQDFGQIFQATAEYMSFSIPSNMYHLTRDINSNSSASDQIFSFSSSIPQNSERQLASAYLFSGSGAKPAQSHVMKNDIRGTAKILNPPKQDPQPTNIKITKPGTRPHTMKTKAQETSEENNDAILQLGEDMKHLGLTHKVKKKKEPQSSSDSPSEHISKEKTRKPNQVSEATH